MSRWTEECDTKLVRQFNNEGLNNSLFEQDTLATIQSIVASIYDRGILTLSDLTVYYCVIEDVCSIEERFLQDFEILKKCFLVTDSCLRMND